MLKFMIPLQPITKKNSQQILINRRTNRPFISPSKKYKQYEKEVLEYLPKLEKPIDFPVNVKCVFWMKTRRKVDLTNLLEAIDDILVKHGILKDDNYNIVVSHDGSRVRYDKDCPRTSIEIERTEPTI